ncbi:MAG: hypothetical protein JO007_18570 [Alphaproteobacteria bacterium]|nr:hypothetical protein [Alphaproteobacteria bacterium]
MNTDPGAYQLLGDIAKRRLTSNYYFISINLIILVISFILVLATVYLSTLAENGTSIKFFNGNILWRTATVSSSTLAILSFCLNFYWAKEQRENYRQHESLYRALISQEWDERGEGPLQRHWNYSGQQMRRSPVFFVNAEFILPLVFAGAQFTPLVVGLITFNDMRFF